MENCEYKVKQGDGAKSTETHGVSERYTDVQNYKQQSVERQRTNIWSSVIPAPRAPYVVKRRTLLF